MLQKARRAGPGAGDVQRGVGGAVVQTRLARPPAPACAPLSGGVGGRSAGSAVGVWTPHLTGEPRLASSRDPGRRRSPGSGLESFPSLPSVRGLFPGESSLVLGKVSLLRTQTFPRKEHSILHLFVTKYL